MKRRKKDCIVFDNTVYLAEENKKSFPLYMRLLQLLAVLGGSYCFITIFTRCFNLKVINSHLYLGIFVTGFVFYIIFIYPAFDLIKVILSLLIYGGMFYHLFGHIKNGFFLLENAVIARASKYYGFEAFRFVADYTREEKDLTIIIIFILIPATGIIAYSLLRGRLTWLAYTVMIIPVVVSFAMGITPPEVQMVVYILVFLFLSVSNGLLQVADYSHNKSGKFQQSMIHRIGIKSALVICLLSLLLFFALKLIISSEQYEKYNRDKIYETKIKIQNRMMKISLEDVSEKFADVKWRISSGRLASSGGLNFGELGRVDKVVYDNTEHLLVKAPLSSVSEGIYLKGYVGSIYTGDSWKTHTGEIIDSYEDIMDGITGEDFEPAIGSSIFIDHYPYRFYAKKGRYTVTYLKADNRFIYAPYFSLFTDKDKVRFEYDLAIMAEEEIKVGTYDYFYNLEDGINENFKKIFINPFLSWDVFSTENLIDYIKYEEKYRSFVYETYTRLPENGLERLKKDFSREAVDRNAENLIDAIAYIKKYLYDNTRYTLAPGRLPGDKDFVEYFLYESKLGYCSHYASAGVLMLRAMGYPARYVEGYAVNRSDLMNSSSIYPGEADVDDSIVEITVKDSNAHAWAEVYIDGFGWIPIEFTVGSGMDDMVDMIMDLEGYEPGTVDVTPTPTVTPTQAPERPSPKPTESPENAPLPTQPSPASGNSGRKEGNVTQKAEESSAGFKWYQVVIPILILTAAIISYIYKRSDKNDADESFSKKALRVYEKIERLFIAGRLLPKKARSLEDNEEYVKQKFTLIPVTEFEACMDIVKKARFGRESISFGEYSVVEEFYNNLYEQVYESLSWSKRLYLRLMSLKKI